MDDPIRIRGARQHNLKGNRRGAPPARADGDYRAVGFGQVLPGAGHPLRGGSAALRRGAFELREAVSRPPRQARCRPDRGAPPRGCDRAAQPGHIEPLNRGNRDRGLRLPAPPLCPRGTHVLPGLRGRGAARHGEQRGGRGRRPARRVAGHDHVSVAAERPGLAPAGGREPPFAGLRAGACRRGGGGTVGAAGRGGGCRGGACRGFRAGLRDGAGRSAPRPGVRAGPRRGLPRFGREPRSHGRRGPDEDPRRSGPSLARAAGRLAGHLLPGGRRRGGGHPGTGRGGGRAALHGDLSLPEPPHPDIPGAGAQALLLQQSLRELSGVHRLRRHPRVRSRAGGPRSGPLARRGRRGPLVQAPLRKGAADAAPAGCPRGGLHLHALEGAAGLLPGRGVPRQGFLPRRDGLPRLEGAEAIQAVPPDFSCASTSVRCRAGRARARACGRRRAG